MNQGPRIYNLFPTLAGSIDEWSEHVPRVAAMGFDWLYINPFNETGASGSLYAVKDHLRLNPSMRGARTEGDADLLRAFSGRARAAGLNVMMDLVINHTARDSGLTESHPDWYKRNANGEIESPSASDPADPANVTVWTDLAELNYGERPERAAMIAYFSGVIRHYLDLGVRGFRCDAAYMVPCAVWAALIADARRIRPDVVFAAENLGAPTEAVIGLRTAGFDYLFNSSKWWDFQSPWLLEQYEAFRRIAPSIGFPESHDTPRLAAELSAESAADLETHYRFRYLFAAFFSTGVMMPMGYEFGFAKNLDVVTTRPSHWEQPAFDLSAFITAVNAMKAAAPALNEEGPQHSIQRNGKIIGLWRATEDGQRAAFALFNPSASETPPVDVQALLHPPAGTALVEVTPNVDGIPERSIALRPYQTRVFASAADRVGPDDEKPAKGRAARSSPGGCVIEAVTPQVDGGRHAVKRIAGDRFIVEADIFREGHDALAAVLRYRVAGAKTWRETPMRPAANDRFSGSFVLEAIGLYEYTIEAWPDAFATWVHDTAIKHAAAQSVSLELIEGRALIDAAADRARKPDRSALRALLAAYAAAATDDARLAVLLSERAASCMELVPDRSGATRFTPALPLYVDRRAAQVGAWYEFFPRSQSGDVHRHGTFADAQRELPRVRELGFDVLYLPPIHPIGHAFRKGPNNSLEPGPGDPGSPWAIGNADGGHRAIEPKLGTLADFDRFVAAAHANGLEIALDYALQCSPDHPYVRDHPEWFSFRPDGTIKYAENPPKKYQDIVNFNWFGPDAATLWDELRDVVLFWIGHGVRIFRVDNPHTKPFAFWEWMIRDVQQRHPGVLFLAEAFTRPKVMQQLAKVGFTQSYTYFTWRNTKAEIVEYVSELAAAPPADYYRPNFFANTPDILPPFLQTGGRPAFLIRLYLAATLSSLYGIYSGFEVCENTGLPGREEYADSEKYELKPRDWNAPGNINADIRRVNRIRRQNPALDDWRNIRFLPIQSDHIVFFMKSRGTNTLLIAINVDPFRAAEAWFPIPLAELGMPGDAVVSCEDVVSGEALTWTGGWASVYLDPQTKPAAIFRIDGPTAARVVSV
jgi:starch synthase (maltosyl-transferring)